MKVSVDQGTILLVAVILMQERGETELNGESASEAVFKAMKWLSDQDANQPEGEDE